MQRRTDLEVCTGPGDSTPPDADADGEGGDRLQTLRLRHFVEGLSHETAERRARSVENISTKIRLNLVTLEEVRGNASLMRGMLGFLDACDGGRVTAGVAKALELLHEFSAHPTSARLLIREGGIRSIEAYKSRAPAVIQDALDEITTNLVTLRSDGASRSVAEEETLRAHRIAEEEDRASRDRQAGALSLRLRDHIRNVKYTYAGRESSGGGGGGGTPLTRDPLLSELRVRLAHSNPEVSLDGAETLHRLMRHHISLAVWASPENPVVLELADLIPLAARRAAGVAAAPPAPPGGEGGPGDAPCIQLHGSPLDTAALSQLLGAAGVFIEMCTQDASGGGTTPAFLRQGGTERLGVGGGGGGGGGGVTPPPHPRLPYERGVAVAAIAASAISAAGLLRLGGLRSRAISLLLKCMPFLEAVAAAKPPPPPPSGGGCGGGAEASPGALLFFDTLPQDSLSAGAAEPRGVATSSPASATSPSSIQPSASPASSVCPPPPALGQAFLSLLSGMAGSLLGAIEAEGTGPCAPAAALEVYATTRLLWAAWGHVEARGVTAGTTTTAVAAAAATTPQGYGDMAPMLHLLQGLVCAGEGGSATTHAADFRERHPVCSRNLEEVCRRFAGLCGRGVAPASIPASSSSTSASRFYAICREATACGGAAAAAAVPPPPAATPSVSEEEELGEAAALLRHDVSAILQALHRSESPEVCLDAFSALSAILEVYPDWVGEAITVASLKGAFERFLRAPPSNAVDAACVASACGILCGALPRLGEASLLHTARIVQHSVVPNLFGGDAATPSAALSLAEAQPHAASALLRLVSNALETLLARGRGAEAVRLVTASPLLRNLRALLSAGYTALRRTPHPDHPSRGEDFDPPPHPTPRSLLDWCAADGTPPWVLLAMSGAMSCLRASLTALCASEGLPLTLTPECEGDVQAILLEATGAAAAAATAVDPVLRTAAGLRGGGGGSADGVVSGAEALLDTARVADSSSFHRGLGVVVSLCAAYLSALHSHSPAAFAAGRSFGALLRVYPMHFFATSAELLGGGSENVICLAEDLLMSDRKNTSPQHGSSSSPPASPRRGSAGGGGAGHPGGGILQRVASLPGRKRRDARMEGVQQRENSLHVLNSFLVAHSGAVPAAVGVLLGTTTTVGGGQAPLDRVAEVTAASAAAFITALLQRCSEALDCELGAAGGSGSEAALAEVRRVSGEIREALLPRLFSEVVFDAVAVRGSPGAAGHLIALATTAVKCDGSAACVSPATPQGRAVWSAIFAEGERAARRFLRFSAQLAGGSATTHIHHSMLLHLEWLRGVFELLGVASAVDERFLAILLECGASTTGGEPPRSSPEDAWSPGDTSSAGGGAAAPTPAPAASVLGMAVICLHCMTRFYLLPEGGASPLRSLRHIEELQRCAHGIAASCIGLLCNVVSCEPHYLRAQLLRRDLPLRLSVLRSCHRLLCDGSARMQHRTSSCLLIATCIHIDRGTWGTRTLAPHPELAAGLATATLGLAERHGVASAGEGFPAAQHALEAVVAVSDSGKAALAASKAFERWVALFDAGRRGQQQQQQQGHHRSTAGAATDAPTHPGGTPGPAVPELVLLRLASVFTALLASFTPPAAGEDAAPPPPLVPPGALWPVTLGRALRHHLAACLPPAAAAAAAGQRKGGGGGGGGGVSPALLHRVEVGLLRLTRAYLLAGVAGESGAPILQEVLDAFLRVRVSPVGISPTALALLECVGCCGGSGKLLSLMRGKGRGAEVAASLGAMVSEAVVSGNAVWGVPLAKALAEVSFSEAGQAWVAEIPGVWECVFGTPQEPQRLYDAAPLHVMTMLRNMCFLKGNKLRLVRNADFVGLLSENLVTANPSLLAVQLKWLSASAVWALVYNMERAKQQLRPLIQPFLVDAAELTAKHLQVEQRTLGGLRLAGETEAEGSELLSMLSECLQQIETLAMLFE